MSDVTGRDRYILIKALVYAIAAIDNRPASQQERSDRDDMARLLASLWPDKEQRDALDQLARAHLAPTP